jgi:hypothetical protein
VQKIFYSAVGGLVPGCGKTDIWQGAIRTCFC